MRIPCPIRAEDWDEKGPKFAVDDPASAEKPKT
jgi:hypothetical protein